MLPPDIALARRAAVRSLLWIALIVAWMLVQSGRAVDAFLAAWLPLLVFLVLPHVLAALSLRARAGTGALAVAVTASLHLVLPFVFYLLRGRTGEEAAFFGIEIVSFLIVLNLAVLLYLALFLPEQWRLLRHAVSAARARPDPVAGRVLAIGVTAALVLTTAWSAFAVGTDVPPALATAEQATRRGGYSRHNAIVDMQAAHTCLWARAGVGAANGFPATLEEATRTCPEWASAQKADWQRDFELTYHPGRPGADGRRTTFAITVRQLASSWSPYETFFMDEGGIIRRASTRRAGQIASDTTSELEYRAPLDVLVRLRDSLVAYRARTPARRLPPRILGWGQADSATIDDLVVRHPDIEYGRTETDGSIVLSRGTILIRATPGDTGALGFTVAYRPPHLTRRYLLDANNWFRGTGEPRHATEQDPLVTELEMGPAFEQPGRRRGAR
ncbi:MAG TPA: hypothetical protein VFZ11_12975 [Gemmatimonadaceae bacterium]